MRLLRREGDTLAFEIANEREFTTPYAILSHTWGEEEVTYQDVLAGRSNRKVLFTLNQAEKDGYSRVWIDTCCIDTTSSAELSKAINLMWKYYSNASICYAYLHGPIEDNNRWFKRGWTLQELIAPREVVFFCDEVRRGTRHDLVGILHRESKIDRGVLSGEKALRDVALVDRYDWIAGRETKEEEDMVYSLLGLFEVTTFLHYGIGLQQAQHDLIERVDKKHGTLVGDQLRASMRAGRASANTTKDLMDSLRFDNMASRRENIKMPVRGTSDWLLEHADFKHWLKHSRHGEDSSSFLWIKGHPGAGKSTLMKFADERSKDWETQISFYFNARGGSLEKSVEGAYRALLVQLLHNSADLQMRVCGYLEETHRKVNSPWTIEVLQALLRLVMNTDAKARVRCFIDALDECDVREVRMMARFFHELSQDARVPFSVCFASRYYPALTLKQSVELRLDQQREHTHAVELYVQRTLLVEDNAFGTSMKDKIIAKAQGSFIWVVLVIQQLNAELERGNIYLLPELIDALPSEVAEIYHALVMRTEQSEQFKLCTQLIHFSSRPLTGTELYFAVLFGAGKLSTVMAESKYLIPSRTDLKRFISSVSRGLAELVSGYPETAQFVHESVADFLRLRGLQSIFPTEGISISACSHNFLKQLLVRYLEQSQFHARHHKLEAVWGTPGQPTWSMPGLDDWPKLGLPLIPLVSRDLIYHAERCSGEINQDDFLRDINWETLSDVHQAAIDSRRRLYIHGLLVSYDAPSLACRILELSNELGQKALGPTPVTEAALLGGRSDIERLLEHGCNVDERDQRGFTALAVLVHQRGRRTVETAVCLIERGARADAITARGSTVLAEACRWNMLGVVRAIIDSGADVNMRDGAGCTALMIACEANEPRAMSLLLDGSAVLEAIDNMRQTALFYCRARVVFDILLCAGADVRATNENGDTALSSLIYWFLETGRNHGHPNDWHQFDVMLALLAYRLGSLPGTSRLDWLRQKAIASDSYHAPLMAALLEYVAQDYEFELIDVQRVKSFASFISLRSRHPHPLTHLVKYGAYLYKEGQWKTELPAITTFSKSVRMVAGVVMHVGDEEHERWSEDADDVPLKE